MDNQTPASIILFDGICNLCNQWVNFMIRRDPHKHFRFAALQSPIGQGLLQKHNLSIGQFDTFILIEDGKVYVRATAILRVARRLNQLWLLLYTFRWIPAPIRDWVYNVVARHRYQIFGKRETCIANR